MNITDRIFITSFFVMNCVANYQLHSPVEMKQSNMEQFMLVAGIFVIAIVWHLCAKDDKEVRGNWKDGEK